MLALLIEGLPYVAIPVLVAHIVLDFYDKHRHGVKLHDWVSVAAYGALAVHFGFEFAGLVGWV